MISLSNINYFLNEFKSYGSQPALIWNESYFTYNQLLDRIEYWRKELDYFHSGLIVGLESDFSPETVSLLFVLIEKKAVIVPFDSNQSLKLVKKKEIAQLDYLIIIDKEERVRINKVESLSQEKNNLFKIIIEKKVPGLLLFTSGSSGEPKGALHDFSKLLSKFQVKRSSLLTINFLLFDHWGGLNTLFQILSNGGTVVILENRNPDYVCSLIEKHKVELLPTSPTFLNMLLLSRAHERFSLKSLKIISYGAEPMPESLLKLLNQVFPNVKLQQTYGLIELGVMRSKSENNDSLWVKVGGEGYQIRVVDDMLQVKSDSAMLGYLNAESPFTSDGWFKTGDAVEVNGDFYKILGRKSEMINVGGEKVFPQEVENIIMELPFVDDVIVYGEDNRLTGKIVCAKIKANNALDSKQIIKEVKTYCRLKLESFKIPVKIFLSEEDFTSQRFKKERNKN